MARRSDHSREELQEMALTAAETLLDEHGGAALSTRKVAAAIGYSVGALYLSFKNLDDLCWQINARTLCGLMNALDQQVDAPNPRERLKGYASAYLSYAQQWSHRWALLFDHSPVKGMKHRNGCRQRLLSCLPVSKLIWLRCIQRKHRKRLRWQHVRCGAVCMVLPS